MEKGKDQGARELEKRIENGEPTFCVGCGEEVKPSDKYGWAKTKGRIVYICHDCAVKEGLPV